MIVYWPKNQNKQKTSHASKTGRLH